MELLWDAAGDTLKLLPFLFLTYLMMEFLEHKAGEATNRLVQKAGKWGPAAGGVLGLLPQCGFSAAAANLYAGRVITMGTLIAILLSTSDEMLPILISARFAPGKILLILGVKLAVAVLAGFLIDALRRGKKEEHEHIHELCEKENCHCEEGILLSAVKHTLQIILFIFLINLLLGYVLEHFGPEKLGSGLWAFPVLGQALAGLIGLIPNCVASVAITRLYMDGAMGFGAMLSGLLVNSGVGMLVLCRVNHRRGENVRIIGTTYMIGVAAGLLLCWL